MTTRKKPLSAIAQRLDKIPSRELYAALGRRSHKRLKEQAPEVLEERVAKSIATTAIRAKYCTHTFLQPKVHVKGPNIGLLCCRSCGVSLEEWVMWLPLARCCDPKHVGCDYEGRCWLLMEPGKAPRCMPCPKCEGFEFKGDNGTRGGIPDWMRLEAETALDAMRDIKEDTGGKWPHVDRALEKIENILESLSDDNERLFPQEPLRVDRSRLSDELNRLVAVRAAIDERTK